MSLHPAVLVFETYFAPMARGGLALSEPLWGLEAWAHDLAHAVLLGCDTRAWSRGCEVGRSVLTVIAGLSYDAQDENEEDALAVELLVLERLGVSIPIDALIAYANKAMWNRRMTVESVRAKTVLPTVLRAATQVTDWFEHPERLARIREKESLCHNT